MTLSKLKSVSQPKCSPPDHRWYESGANLLTLMLAGKWPPKPWRLRLPRCRLSSRPCQRS